MTIIDTSVWVARFLEEDSQHEKGREAVDGLSNVLKYTCYAVIEETTTILCYKHSKEQADKFIDYITNNPEIVILEHNISKEAQTFLAVNAELSFADVSIISLSKQHNLRITSFDQQLLKVANKL